MPGIRQTTRPGQRRHAVTVQNPTRTADTEGGFTEAWVDATPSTWMVAMQSATDRALERVMAGSVQSRASHIVSGHYRSDVSTRSRLVLDDVYLYVRDVNDVNMLGVELIAVCEGVTA